MKTRTRIYTVFVIVILSMILTATTFIFYTIDRVYRESEAYRVSTVRNYTSSIMNEVRDVFPNIDEIDLENKLDNLNITTLILDVNGNVLFDNATFDTDTAVLGLDQVEAYSYHHTPMLKGSFHITNDDSIVGFIIFGIPEKVLIETPDNSHLIVIWIEIVITLALIVYLVIIYKKIVLDPIKQLDHALLDISNGIYNKLKSNKWVSIKSFTNYNIMLEQMERTLSIQADYEKSRKQLIANISHEIRTPLSYVKLSTELLASNESMDESSKKYINTILSKITEIDKIIEDLFRYSKQDLDKLLVVLKETYSKDMFQHIFANIKLKDPSKKIVLKTTCNIPNVLINADENRLIQVVSNLVDNAEKHIVDKGFINVKAEIEENHLVLIVEDSGEGIAPKDLPYIFEAFYQGTQDEKTKTKGSGLGLAICEYIIKKHNGEIFVYSEVGKGTKFVIKFQEIE